MAINATLGTVEYRENGGIAVPVTFPENVIAPSKSIFEIKYVSGDALTDIEYRLVGQDTAFAVVIEMPLDRKGRFQIAANGDVLKVSSGGWENVVVTAKNVDYNTSVPDYKKYDEDFTPNVKFDVILQLDTEVTLTNPVTYFGSDDATYLDFFLFEGAAFSLPNIYRKTNNMYPTLPIANFSNINGNEDWTNTNLQTEETTIYLLRWSAVGVTTEPIFAITIKPGLFSGPVS